MRTWAIFLIINTLRLCVLCERNFLLDRQIFIINSDFPLHHSVLPSKFFGF